MLLSAGQQRRTDEWRCRCHAAIYGVARLVIAMLGFNRMQCRRVIADLSLLDTPPSFLMWPAFPTSEYYDDSAPPVPFGR